MLQVQVHWTEVLGDEVLLTDVRQLEWKLLCAMLQGWGGGKA